VWSLSLGPGEASGVLAAAEAIRPTRMAAGQAPLLLHVLASIIGYRGTHHTFVPFPRCRANPPSYRVTRRGRELGPLTNVKGERGSDGCGVANPATDTIKGDEDPPRAPRMPAGSGRLTMYHRACLGQWVRWCLWSCAMFLMVCAPRV
jgi:hypothetical protein